MRTAATTIQFIVRLGGTLQLALGLLFWAGYALDFVGLHMLLGILLVLALWALAGMAIGARVAPGLAALAFAWGLVTPVLGMAQTQLLPGGAHWLIRVLHLLVGLGLLALGETLARRIRDARPAAREQPAAIG